MNPNNIQAALILVSLAEQIFAQIQQAMSGATITDAQLAAYKAMSDDSSAIIQAWKPAV